MDQDSQFSFNDPHEKDSYVNIHGRDLHVFAIKYFLKSIMFQKH